MSNGKLLRQLIRSGADGDLDAFRGVAKQFMRLIGGWGAWV